MHRIDDLLDQLQHVKYVGHIVIHVFSLMSIVIVSREAKLISGRKKLTEEHHLKDEEIHDYCSSQ
jgi:hypothetical protein